MKLGTCPKHGRQPHTTGGLCQACEYEHVTRRKVVLVESPAGGRAHVRIHLVGSK